MVLVKSDVIVRGLPITNNWHEDIPPDSDVRVETGRYTLCGEIIERSVTFKRFWESHTFRVTSLESNGTVDESEWSALAEAHEKTLLLGRVYKLDNQFVLDLYREKI